MAPTLVVESFPADTAGYAALLVWLETFGPVDTVGVESTGTRGAGWHDTSHPLASSIRSKGDKTLSAGTGVSPEPAVNLDDS